MEIYIKLAMICVGLSHINFESRTRFRNHDQLRCLARMFTQIMFNSAIRVNAQSRTCKSQYYSGIALQKKRLLLLLSSLWGHWVQHHLFVAERQDQSPDSDSSVTGIAVGATLVVVAVVAVVVAVVFVRWELRCGLIFIPRQSYSSPFFFFFFYFFFRG